MKSIYKKYFTTIAIWAGCFILFCFVYMLVLAPQKKNKKQIEKQLTQKKQTYDSVLRAARKETKIQLNKQVEHLRDKLKVFVIDPEDLADLIFDIGQIASEKKVTSFNIRTKDSRRGSAIPDCKYLCENQIDISFTASFNQFATFLNTLERNQPVVFVDKFTITRSDQDYSGHHVDMNLAVLLRKRQDS